MLCPRLAKFAATATAGGIETDGVARFDVGYSGTDSGDGTGAVAPENMRKRRWRGTETAPNQNIEVIDRCGFESNDSIMGRRQLRIIDLFVTQIVNATVGVEPNSFQVIVPKE